ncbi:unnamed protein product [Effrenium voratum]|uniref:Uncharacterized protein n=1 Tax=Effrenium voratum TaxID=2562239 RepID=A0AA36N2F3_9DINO|nr:unnamed protein product [Effrenium voratum]CAJ1458762.1 unnamed protein product [Effrenium voratum]
MTTAMPIMPAAEPQATSASATPSEAPEEPAALEESEHRLLEERRLARLEEELLARLDRGSLSPAEESRLNDIRRQRADLKA